MANDVLKINDLELNDGVSYALMREDGFVPRPAAVRQQLSDSPFTSGQRYRKTLSKPENQELPFRVKVIGTSKTDLDAKLNALYDEVVKDESIITWLPDGRTYYSYWTAYGSPSGEVDSYFSHDYQTAEICILSWMMLALPGPQLEEVELAPVWCLGDDNSFEKNDGADLQFWHIHTFGIGAWGKASGAGQFLHGLQSLYFGPQPGLGVATEKTLIQVDELEHCDWHAFLRKGSDVGDVDFQLKCYDSDGIIIGDNDGNILEDEACSFEGGSFGDWRSWLINCTEANSGAEYYHGSRSLELTVTANGTAELALPVTTFTSGGVEYTLAAKLKSASGRQYTVRLWDDVAGYQDGGLITADGTWQTATVTATFNIASIDRRLYFYAHVDALAGDIVYWDSAILKAGASATPPTDLGIVDVLIGDDPTTEFLDRLSISAAQGIIHPSNSGEAVRFRAGTAQVKRRIQHGGDAPIYIDDLYFANSEYAPGYKIRPTMGLAIPGADIPGNLPADADLYFSHPYAQLNWATQTIPDAGQSLQAASFVDATHGWAISMDGKVYFWNGTSWILQADLGAFTYGIFAFDADNVWVCGVEKVWYFNGAAWDGGTIVKAGITWWDLWGSAANSVWVVGDGGEIYFWNGAAWAAQASGVAVILFCIDGSAANNVWAAGESGTAVHWNGAAWATDSPGEWAGMSGITVLDATHAWACQSVLHRIYFHDGTSWILIKYIYETLTDIFAIDATNIWVSAAGGHLSYYDGSSWEAQPSGTSEQLNSIDGIDVDNIWVVGQQSTIRVNWLTAEAVPFTDIYVGQRHDYHADYNPVVQPTEGAVAYLYTRMDSDYRTLAAAATAQARFLLAAHEGSHLLTIGITFSGATAFDKCNVKLLLQTPQGVAITGDEVEIEIDMGDPATVWQEVAMLATRFDPIDIPSHYARADAGAIYEVVRVTADAALAAVELWLDHIALIPVDRYVEVKDFDKNSLIFSSRERRAVLSSLNGTLGQAQAWDAAKKIGTPRFRMSSAGANFAICAVYDDYGESGDHQVGHMGIPWNLVIRWEPRQYLTPRG